MRMTKQMPVLGLLLMAAPALAVDGGDHWAFKPPVRPTIPRVKDAAWVRNPIDAFVAAEREKRGLSAAPQADKATLLRRVYLDLIGLPPTREELHAFLSDPSPDAYERVVDRLLASPQYGERWGRHWMDVWRYSDWAGFVQEVRDSQPHIWRWRDWIVESLNADKGYDRMVMEMLAGDELAPDDPNTLRATGFLARSWYKFNRNVWLENTVEHTCKAFLGLTVNCAKCHDHKYDPISQKEHYALRAFFEAEEVRTDRVPGRSDTTKDGLVRVYDGHATDPTYVFIRGDEKEPAKEEPLAPAVPAVFGAKLSVAPVSLPAAAYYPGLRPFEQDEGQAAANEAVRRARREVETAEAAVVAAQQSAEALGAKLKEPTTRPAVVLSDDFATARPDVWRAGTGRWSYRDGHLLQEQTGEQECGLTSLAAHPRDFTAQFTFKITGGVTWRSVGLSFDVDGGETNEAYLCARTGGTVASIFYRHGGNPQYPADSTKPMPVELDRPYTLRVDVRDRLVNVYLDDALVLVHRLPHARRQGRFAVWAFDATAHFLHTSVEPLAADAKMVEAIGQPPTSALEAANAVVSRAQKHSTVVRLVEARTKAARDFGLARIAADKAKFAVPPAAGRGIAWPSGGGRREAAGGGTSRSRRGAGAGRPRGTENVRQAGNGRRKESRRCE